MGAEEDKVEMVKVPRRPTKEMLVAAWADALAEDPAGVWNSMIEAWLAAQKGKFSAR